MLLIINRLNVVSNLKLSLTFNSISRLISSNALNSNMHLLKPVCLTVCSQQKEFATFERLMQKEQPKKQESAFSSLVHKQESGEVSTHFKGVKKVKQAATDLTYLAIIGVGAAMLFVIGYYLFSELFTRETPSGIYDESSKMCLENIQVEKKTLI